METLPTQIVEATPPPNSPLIVIPPSPLPVARFSATDHQDDSMSRGIETEAIQNLVEQRDALEEKTYPESESVHDAEMLGEYWCNTAVPL